MFFALHESRVTSHHSPFARSNEIYLGLTGLACSLIYAVNFRLSRLLHLGSTGDSFISLACQVVPLGILYLAGVLIVFRRESFDAKSSGAIYVILFFALLFRLLLVPTQPLLSSDINRYIWDGRVQGHGINPYLYPPGAAALSDLRDEAIWPHMSRHTSPSIYPAGAQILFHALNRLGIDSISAFKGTVVLFDMGSVLVLMTILSTLGFARERALVYAWHPLVIFELAGSGHLEGFMVFFVLLSLLLLVKTYPKSSLSPRPATTGEVPPNPQSSVSPQSSVKNDCCPINHAFGVSRIVNHSPQSFLSISFLALAASLKLYPAIMLPAVLRDKKIRGFILFFTLLALTYIPYLNAGKRVVGFLPQYLENPRESFNLGLKAYLLQLFPGIDPMVFTAIFAAVLLTTAVIIWINPKDNVTGLKAAYVLASLQIVLTAASLHPWYVIWIVPFLAVFPSPAWFYFSFAVFISYLAYSLPGERMPEWVLNVEYIPLFILLTAEVITPRSRKQEAGIKKQEAGSEKL